ncbi:unnamed protein product [Rotaria socialis]|uniref:Uncharacterized protein n=1 Tax=Rotaria socialis TaxID=392032 RepID=A0A818BP67_9BILA|nr:unnamed protein product [Rotaria socialis]CAF3418267.1 unnamed protein product [Rotaria socialis]CAF3494745.1 unnamed protein product [Rotaria socialis]CAF4521087.1 unnamed protein product [Rotaria socialis]CAF4521150.1 unnamed protein product [Rotaria socialis]
MSSDSVSYLDHGGQLRLQALNDDVIESELNKMLPAVSNNALDYHLTHDDAHWPKIIGNKDFSFPLTPAIPPQLCLLIKNVDLRIDFDDISPQSGFEENIYGEKKLHIRHEGSFGRLDTLRAELFDEIEPGVDI